MLEVNVCHPVTVDNIVVMQYNETLWLMLYKVFVVSLLYTCGHGRSCAAVSNVCLSQDSVNPFVN